MIPAQAVEAQPEPCEYCSIAANALKVHDGSCDGMTEQEWRELRGEGVLGMSEVIPTEAIEAAADMIGSLRLGDRRKFLTEAQLILEAAAPHMLADAWESGYTLGYADCANKQESNRPNPHKETS